MKSFKYLVIAFLFTGFGNALWAQTATPTKNIPLAEHYEGGQDSLYAFVKRTVRYPLMAKRNRIQGECIVNVILDADGKANDFHLVKNIGAGCGEEAVRIVKLLKFKAPGYRVQSSIPIIFKL